MKKLNIILTVFLSIFIMGNVKAKASISVTPTSKTILVGNSITVSVTIKSDTSLGAVSYTVDYDKNVLSLTKTTSPTGGARTVGYFSTKGNNSLTYTYTFKALKSGSSNISIIGAEAGDDNGSKLSVSSSTATIKVITQKELEATYSSNNYLSSLSIEGYELSFNKTVDTYNVDLKPETENIKISASKEDYRSTINGIGDISVSEGINTIKIDVVAQNGNIRTYTIIAKVLEYDPVNVNIEGQVYTLVRSKKVQTLSNNLFEETVVNISGYDVPAFYNELTNTTLVALKDASGNIEYYIYDNNTYTKFIELKLGIVDLILKDSDVPKYFYKTSIIINDTEYNAYKYNDTSRYALFYGTNLVNSNTSYYLYDNFEGTLQRYDDGLIMDLDNKLNTNKIIIYSLIATSSGLFILLLVSLLLKHKKKVGV